MPRAERPIDAEETELGAFAADLRRLREKAGKPAYRELASRAHYSSAALADAASGRKLPTLAVTLAYVGACGGDAEEWEKRWRLIASPPDATDDAPYVGLTAFQPQDADRFFGREKLTRKLEELVATKPFVGVVGPSGSGKSSLLRAGLVPRLGNALVFTPGALPADECAVRLAQLTGESAVALRAHLDQPAALGLLAKQHDVVLVVDQFEEIFTLCDVHQRDWFITALTSAPRVVVGVRADFYGHVGRHPELVEALDGAQLLVGPMTADELRRAITEPANRVGATVETALLTRLMVDVAGQAAALPLVQHALVETWHRRRGMTLTLAGYLEAGGIEHAISRTAETVFNDLSEQQQTTAKQIFLRLIALGEGTEDTKRRATRSDLDDDVLEHLANARLVTLTEQHAELAHEALLSSWPRLRDWIAEDRGALRVHQQLTEAAAAWDGDRDLLYKGARLVQASELNPNSLTERERDFLNASQADGRRRARRMRVAVSVLSVLVLLLAGMVVFAVGKAQEAAEQRDVAVTGRAGSEARRLALVPSVRAQEQAIHIALAAYRVTPDEANRDLLLGVYATARREQREQLATSQLHKIGQGRFYAESDYTEPDTPKTRLWDLRGNSSKPYLTLTGRVVAASDDDRRVLVEKERGVNERGVKEHHVELQDIADRANPRIIADIPLDSAIITANGAVDTIGGRVTSVDHDVLKIWRYDGAGRPHESVVPSDREVSDFHFYSDGKALIMMLSDPGALEIWSLEGDVPSRVSEVAMPSAEPNIIHFSPDGRFLLVADVLGGSATMWDVSDPRSPVVWADLTAVLGRDMYDTKFTLSRFTPDSRQLLISTNQAVDVWDLTHRGMATRIARFENLTEEITTVDRWPSEDGFVAVTRGYLVPLRTNLDRIFQEQCRLDGAATLSDEDWVRYFPGVERVPVC